jgi:hypothetical protein
MKRLSFVIIIVFLVVLTSESFCETRIKDVSPILNAKDIPGYFLHDSYKKILDWNELDLTNPLYSQFGIDVKKMKSDRVISFDESWLTIRKEEYKKKRKENFTDYSVISVKRDYLMTREAAYEWAKSEVIRPRCLEEGSYSGVLIGDKCWSNKFAQNGKSPKYPVIILFFKNKTVVEVCLFNRNGNPNPKFAEKIAQIVASRI